MIKKSVKIKLSGRKRTETTGEKKNNVIKTLSRHVFKSCTEAMKY